MTKQTDINSLKRCDMTECKQVDFRMRDWTTEDTKPIANEEGLAEAFWLWDTPWYDDYDYMAEPSIEVVGGFSTDFGYEMVELATYDEEGVYSVRIELDVWGLHA